MASRKEIEWLLIGAMLANKELRTAENVEAFADPVIARIANGIVRGIRGPLVNEFESQFRSKQPGESLVSVLLRLLRATCRTKRYLDAVKLLASSGAVFLSSEERAMVRAELDFCEALNETVQDEAEVEEADESGQAQGAA